MKKDRLKKEVAPTLIRKALPQAATIGRAHLAPDATHLDEEQPASLACEATFRAPTT